MRTLFIAAGLAGMTLMACSLYYAGDPSDTTAEDQPSAASDRDRGHGHRGHRDAGTGNGDANPGANDAGVPDDGRCCDDPDGGVFPDGRPY